LEILLFILLALIIALYFLTRWLWSKGENGRLILCLGLVVLIWGIQDAIFPPESFYKSELKRLVNVDLPNDTKFQFKNASLPDLHGDYSACFIVLLSPNSWATLKASIESEPVQHSQSDGCTHKRGTRHPWNLAASQYTLTKRSTREDAEIQISLIPNENLAVISWYLW
jgi:hypothetical protein